MTSLSKKLMLSLMALLAALCLALGLLFSASGTALAADGDTGEGETIPCLKEKGDFDVTNNVITGLRTSVTSEFTIEIPEGITAVGNGEAILTAAQAKLLKGVKVSSTVETIGASAFYGCSAIGAIDLTGASKLSSIGANAFNTGVSNNVNSNTLVSLTVPAGVMSLGNNAFANHTGLQEINFLAENCGDVSALANNPFYRAGYSFANGVTFNIGNEDSAVKAIPANLLYGSAQYEHKVSSVNFKNVQTTETSFGNSAFKGSHYIKTVTFANCSIPVIGEEAFADCSLLESVALPASTTEIKASAFKGCSALGGATLGGTAKIGDFAFQSTGLTTLTLPASVETVGQSAFNGNTKLADVHYLGNSIKTIGQNAFSGCTSLKYMVSGAGASSENILDLPASLTTINSSAFANCSLIEKVTVPENVTTIGASAFSGLTSLNTINYYAKSCQATPANSPFTGGSDITINIGKAGGAQITWLSTNLFRSTNVKTVKFNNVNLSETSLGSGLFYGCTSLTDVSFVNTSMTVIKDNMFNGCTSLTNIPTLPDNVTTICVGAFADCPSLYRVTVPSTVKEIQTNAYGGKTKVLQVINNSPHITIAKGSTDNGSLGLYALAVNEDGNIDDVNGFLFLGNALIGYIGTATEIVLPAYKGNYNYSISNGAFKGNAVITDLTVPQGVKDIGNEAFRDCTSLSTVNILSDSTTMIGDNAFQGCTNLNTVSFGKNLLTIGEYAFSGCSSLENVSFGGNALTTIDMYAFEGCSSLEVFRTPSNVTGIGGYAFSGCSSLTTFYLPASISNPNSNIFYNNNTNLLLIAPDKTSYSENYYGKGFVGLKLTYVVDIKLVYGEYTGTDAEHSVYAYKLFNMDAHYTLNEENGKWEVAGDIEAMPKQEGYEIAVWYFTSAYTNEVKVTMSTLTTKLADAGWEPVLYAQSLAVPEYRGAGELIYKGAGSDNGVFGWTSAIVDANGNNISDTVLTQYAFEIVTYNYITGESAAIPANLSDAGVYGVKISIADEAKYGQWADNDARIITVTINRALANITDSWVIVANGVTGNLNPVTGTTTIYVYQAGDKEVAYLDQQTNLTPVENRPVRDVTSSYTNFTGQPLKLEYRVGSDSLIKVDEKSYTTTSDSTGMGVTNSGVYRTDVTVTVDRNYTIASLSDDDILTHGLSVSGSGSTYVISKTWYILSSITGKLIDSTGNDFVVNDWTYLTETEGAIPTQPAYTEEGVELTFSLVKGVNSSDSSSIETIVKELEVSSFSNVFNSSMPAGDYKLTVNVKSSSGETLPLEMNFTVSPADLATIMSRNGVKGSVTSWFDENKPSVAPVSLNNYKYRLANDNNLHIDAGNADRKISDLRILNFAPSQVNPREGIWSGTDYAKYYSTPVITYNVYKMGVSTVVGNEYYTESELRGITTAPLSMGLYEIYFNITCDNFNPLVSNSNEMRSYKYSLTLYDSIGLPVVAHETYTGKPIKNFNISNSYYSVIYLDPADTNSDVQAAIKALNLRYSYTDVGTYQVALKINPTYSDVCAWNSNVVTGANGAYALLTVYIDAAQNSAQQSSIINTWVWGRYDAQVNRPLVTTTYETTTKYTITNNATGESFVYNATGNEKDFILAPAGTYTLKAEDQGKDKDGNPNTNWSKYQTVTWTVIISKATVYWEKTPYVESWRYGEYALRFSEPVYKLASAFEDIEDDLEIYYCLASELSKDKGNRKTYASLDAMCAELKVNEVPAGSYVLMFELPESSNYIDWSDEIHFSVIKAENYWDVTPSMFDWMYGEFADRVHEPEAVPHFTGTVKFVYERLNEAGNPVGEASATLAGLADDNGEVPVGRYRLIATVTGSDNYDMRETSVLFNVNKANNSWIEIPSVISWSEGRYKADTNYPKAIAKFGEVEYTITDENGNEYDLSKIRNLGVGSYKLRAFVKGNGDYSDLEATATFAVFEDSVGMTGLIAATIVFAVIAVGLAVAGVVLLIRKNKKIEEDFRKMVKSELKRR